MRVPRHVDVENIHAEFKGGLLEVVLPKIEDGDKGSEVEIKVK